jgi:iron-sulfur cluster assembly accessory protein|tara:strand:+ start:199 stop:543 length:345 start_codon:yes stop_codon:yes gene_type:complete
MESIGTLLVLTSGAVEKIEEFVRDHSGADTTGLRVAVLPGGCSGFQYSLNIEDAPESDDEILEISGVKIFVDPFSAQYLDGIEIDYVSSMMGAGFTFSNPNATGGCGCGSSFTA